MPLKSLESLFRSERRSFLHLVNEAWRQTRRFCVRCQSTKIYRLADKRYRCARCGYTFHDFTRRWIGELNLTARQWLWIIKLFELEIPPSQLAKEISVSYPTALKAIYLIRRAIAEASDDDHDVRLVGATADGPAVAPTGRAFGLLEREGRIHIVRVEDLSVETVLREQPKFVKQGPIIFTGPFREYDALVLWRFRLSSGVTKRLSGGKPGLDGLDAFWNFARSRLARFRRSSDQDLYYFLKELAFRYEHRDKELFETLVRLMTQLMPKNLFSGAKTISDFS
jgi:transposase